jgi:hypothetical protein
MKKIYLILTILMISVSFVKGQQPFYSCTVNFEDDPCWEASYWNLTVPGVDNIWQICVPNKTVFNSALSSPHAILTDSTGVYPVNNTSDFVIKAVLLNNGGAAYMLGGWYKFDSDSLKDYGRIEISSDHGTTWLNALSDTVIPDFCWSTAKPVLTGRIHQWRQFNAILWNSFSVDTLYYRFTFISDSIQTNQDGWMLDDIQLTAHIEGIPEIGRDEIKIYPNPATELITISAKTFSSKMNVLVYDIVGQLCLQKMIFGTNEDIDISGLGKGIYMVKVSDGNKIWVRKVVKE